VQLVGAELDVERVETLAQVLDAVRPDHRDRRERLGEHPCERDRIGGRARAAAELRGAGAALAVGRVAVDACRLAGRAREVPAGLCGPREQQHPGPRVPGQRLGAGRRHAARPRRLVLHGEREVRAVAADPRHPAGGGVRIRLLDPLE